MIVLDARKFTDPQSSHEYLKRRLQLPEHYGENLDALHDCLTDLHGKVVAAYTLRAGEYYSVLRQVFTDSAEENACLEFSELKGACRRCRTMSNIRK